jgi:serine protease Do
MRGLPDWLIYTLALTSFVWVLFAADGRRNTDPTLPEGERPGALLRPESGLDAEVLVEVGPISSGVGTAFAIDTNGWWVTAKHVVTDCKRVGIIVGRRPGSDRPAATEVRDIRESPSADIALLKTDSAPAALALALDEADLRYGQVAYHIGFPQGRQGEAMSVLMERQILVAQGRYSSQEPVLAWAERSRTQGLRGSLSGISGGPALDARGRVIGVTIAEASRRGRIYTSAPSSLRKLLETEREAVKPNGEPVRRMNERNYGLVADSMRRDLAVAQVVCIADDGTPSEPGAGPAQPVGP